MKDVIAFVAVVVIIFLSLSAPFIIADRIQDEAETRLQAKCEELHGKFYRTFCQTPDGQIIELSGDAFIVRLPE